MALPIANGNTATAFADGEFTVLVNAPATLFITGAVDGGVPGGVDFEVAFKTAGGQYNTLITINAYNMADKATFRAPATYAVRRLASTAGSAGLELKA